MQAAGDASSPSSKLRHTAQTWAKRLVGKKFVNTLSPTAGGPVSSFTRGDLPPGARVIQSSGVYTADFVEDRVNVHVDDDDVCYSVSMG